MRHRAISACLAAFLAASLAWAATTWSVVPTLNRGTVGSVLQGVAGVADAEVWAVGHFYDTKLAAFRTLIERWDGRSWTIVPSPNLGTAYNDVYGVAVDPSGNAAWAVGYGGNPHQALILAWSGAAWQMAALPSLGPGASTLYAASASAANDAWAVGWLNEAGRLVPLTLHWNGSAWKRIPAAVPTGTMASLQAVAAAGPDDVWAGGYTYIEGRHRAFVEHWNGRGWSVVAFPRVATGISYVWTLSALSSGEAWAAGEENGVPLVARWDGLRWNRVSRPSVGTGRNAVSTIVARGADDVWVAGYANDTSLGTRTLVQHWNGSGWTTEATPNPGPYSRLAGLAALPSGRLWAAGSRQASEGDVTLSLTR
jgi:hypothetical protein